MLSFPTSANVLPIVVFASFGIIGLAVWRVYRANDDGAPVRWGMTLIGAGLCAYLLSRRYGEFFSVDQAETQRNFFIIIAGIGANILAGGAMVNVGKTRANGAMYRRYPGKVVISQSLWGRLFVITIVPAPKLNEPVNARRDEQTSDDVPQVKE